MRARHRYLAVRLVGGTSSLSEDAFRDGLWQQLQQLYGELGVSRIGFWLMMYDPESYASIIRCQHDQARVLRAALAAVTAIRGVPLLLHVVGMSGTINRAKMLIPGLKAYKSAGRRRAR
jgi:ribonuclease P/MRP protein subunit POP5